jgi:hypothetical protein
MPERVRRGRGCSCLCALWVCLAGASAAQADDEALSSEPVFEVQKLDGTTASGRIVRLAADGGLSLEGASGGPIPLQEVVSLTRAAGASRPAPEGGLILFPEGDRLRAIIGAGSETALEVLPGALGDQATPIPLDRMLGVILTPPQDPAAQDALVRKVRGEARGAEVLWLANGDRLTGSLLGITNQSISFQPDTGPVTIGRSSVIALGFDPATVHYPRPDGTFLELTFLDGSRLGVADARVERGQLLAHARFGAEIRVPLGGLSRIIVRSDRVVYLSERPPAATQFVGYLGEHVQVFGRDTTWDGQPLQLGGQGYDRGLGTVPRTLLAYRLDPADKKFQALVGLDERAGELGSVVFRVLVDGKERSVSPALTRRSDPLFLNVDVSGGKLLILITEFGERGDVQDFADWAEARLVR